MIGHAKRKPQVKFNIFLIIALLFINFFYPITVQAAENELVTIKGSEFVADTFNGVDALYRVGGNDGSSSTYSCAAFVKKYYKEVYGVTPNNMFYNRTPKVSGDSFVTVTDPQVGDIAAMNTGRSSTHWAIVKSVGDKEVTLIEQNWKWSQGGKYVTKINRTVSISSTKFYRLSSENEKVSSMIILNND